MYSALAKFYDSFMDDVPYDKWLDFIASELGDNLRCGADLGCGTGRITLGLYKRGYNVYGLDISREMLMAATDNADECGASILWVQGDINKLRFAQPLEFVTAMCDTINYAAKPSLVFKNVYDNLVNGGKFIFDISTEYKLKNILDGNTYSQTKDDITYVWQNVLSGGRLYMDLMFFAPKNGLYAKTEEQSFQYAHSTDSILDALKNVGFRALAYGAPSKRAVKADSQRIFFVATKD